MNDILFVVVYLALCILGADYEVSLITAGLFYVGFHLVDIGTEMKRTNTQLVYIKEALKQTKVTTN